MKANQYNQTYGSSYFWRTHAQQEIDYIEDCGGRLHVYGFKLNPKAKAKFSKTFTDAYLDATTRVISKENFEKFLSSDT